MKLVIYAATNMLSFPLGCYLATQFGWFPGLPFAMVAGLLVGLAGSALMDRLEC